MGCTTPKEGTYRLEVEINSNETHGMMGRVDTETVMPMPLDSSGPFQFHTLLQ